MCFKSFVFNLAFLFEWSLLGSFIACCFVCVNAACWMSYFFLQRFTSTNLDYDNTPHILIHRIDKANITPVALTPTNSADILRYITVIKTNKSKMHNTQGIIYHSKGLFALFFLWNHFFLISYWFDTFILCSHTWTSI